MSHRMRPFGDLLPHDDALARLLAAVAPTGRSEELPLLAARGRVVAREVRAPMDVPPFARATMDGYALRSADAAAPGASLRLAGAAHAGHPFEERVGAGDAVRIATGAPVPAGADAVVRVEDTRESDGRVEVLVAVPAGGSIDPAGADLAKGGPVVAPGERLTPARLGLLASVGLASVHVAARPRVSVHPSGDELLRPGEPAAPGRIYESNGTTLAALFEGAGADVVRGAALPDELDALRRALREAAARADVVVTTGGASVGERDLVVDALRAEGEVLFHGVRVKPGKPLLAGRIGGALFVGLPGNPTSALSNAALFVLPVIEKLSGAGTGSGPGPGPGAGASRAATLAEPVHNDGDRFLVLPVRVEQGRAHYTFKGSGALTSLARSDGWVGVPPGASLEAGAPVEVHAW